MTKQTRSEADAGTKQCDDVVAGSAVGLITGSGAPLAIESGELLRGIIESSPDCIKILDLEGNLLSMSTGGKKLLEIADLAPLIGKPWIDWWSGETRKLVANALATARAGGTGEFEAFAATAGGTPKWWSVSVTPIRSENGEPAHLLSVSRDVTERRDATESLQERELQLRLIFESVKDFAIFTIDLAGRVTSWNAGAEGTFGFTSAEILGNDAEILWTPEDRAADVPRKERETAATIGYAPDERWHQRKDGTQFFASGFLRPMMDATDELRGFTKVCRDVTRRIETERQLAEARAKMSGAIEAERTRLLEAFDRSPSFLAILRGPGHVFELVNAQYYQLIGKRDVVGKTVVEALPEIAGQGFVELLDRVLQTGERFVGREMLVRLQRNPDEPAAARFVDFVYQPIRDAEGAVDGIIVHGIDVTENKLARDTVEHLSEQRRLALDSAHLGTWHFDLTTQTVAGDERFREIFGVAGQQLDYETAINATHPDDRARVEAAVAASIFGDHPREYAAEYRVVRPDGSVRWIIGKGRAQFSGEGSERRAVSLVGTVADITEAKTAGDALRESETKFRELADAMPQIVWQAGPDGHVDYYNQRWHSFVGQLESDGEQEGWAPALHPDDLAGVREAWMRALQTGEPYEKEFRLKRASDGVYRWHLGRGLAVKDAAGQVLRWFGTNTDIDDRKQLEEQNSKLLDSERAARAEAERAGRMKDEFLATLSHEIRTPLNAIMGWTQILRGSSPTEEDLDMGLSTIERNARSQAKIIEDLLDMSRIVSGKVRIDVQRIELAPIVEAAIESIRPAAEAKGVRLVSVLDPLASPVSGDPNRLQQIFWNLLSNAVKFTTRGGRVQVLLERVTSHLEVSVVDSGIGIAPEFLPYVFDRFRQADASTTRRQGGLGLGLAIVKQLVELHGGTARVKSGGPNLGTTFTVSLPLTVMHPDPESTPERRHPTEGDLSMGIKACRELGGVRVLVVDDEPDARSLVKRLLQDCQASVRTAGTADEAYEVLQGAKFDVLVSDIGMPDEDGYSLMRRVRALSAENNGSIPAVALTAYARAEDRMKAVLAGFQMHLAKPVEAAELLTMVASLAGRTNGGRSAE